jgi:hypothetical protein
MKKFAFLAAAILGAGTANAEPVHTSMIHEGNTVTVSYHPQSKTTFTQSGRGFRANTVCLWETTAWAERRVTDASGRTIPALTRKIGERKAGSSNEAGYCNMVQPDRTAAFGGDKVKLKAFVAALADGDAGRLRAELTGPNQAPAAS